MEMRRRRSGLRTLGLGLGGCDAPSILPEASVVTPPRRCRRRRRPFGVVRPPNNSFTCCLSRTPSLLTVDFSDDCRGEPGSVRLVGAAVRRKASGRTADVRACCAVASALGSVGKFGRTAATRSEMWGRRKDTSACAADSWVDAATTQSVSAVKPPLRTH